MEDLAMTVEKVAWDGNMKQPYDTTKGLAEKQDKPGRPVENKADKPIIVIQEYQNMWVVIRVYTL